MPCGQPALRIRVDQSRPQSDAQPMSGKRSGKGGLACPTFRGRKRYNSVFHDLRISGTTFLQAAIDVGLMTQPYTRNPRKYNRTQSTDIQQNMESVDLSIRIPAFHEMLECVCTINRVC